MAAVLASGESAVLSHRSAGELWGVLKARARGSPPIDVTVPGHGGRKRQRGISLHRSSTLTDADRIVRDGIPLTTPARTMADLRPVLSEPQFAAAVREAEFRRLPIQDAFDAPRTRTELEALFLAVVRRHRLPLPEVNAKVGGYEVDFLWRAQRLIVEADGWGAHRTRSAFEGDRARDARLKALGFEVLRFTWRQIEADPALVASTVRAVLRPAA